MSSDKPLHNTQANFAQPLRYQFAAEADPDMPDKTPRAAPMVEDEAPPKQLRGYSTHAYDDIAGPIYLPRYVDFQARLREELQLRQPPQPFPEDPGSDDDSEQLRTIDPEPCTEQRPYPVIDLRAKRALQDAETARKAPMRREQRFRKVRKVQESGRRVALAISQVPSAGPFPPVGEGLQYEPGSMCEGTYKLPELVGRRSRLKMHFVNWDGRAPKPIVDKVTQKVVAVLGGGARNLKIWNQDVEAATKACADIIPQVRLSDAERNCGSSPSLTGGLGLAQEGETTRVEPGKSAVLEAIVFTTLFAHLAVRRIAGYAGYAKGLFYMFAKQMHDIMEHSLQRYEAYYTGSQRPLPRSPFSAATFELGPNPRRRMDFDPAWTWVALTALGFFDSMKGGHIILWDFNMVIRFPAGATILLPRALVRYSFVDIEPTETRYCLVQYTPAPIFTFTENDNRSDVNFAKFATRSQHETRESRRAFEIEMLWPLDYMSHIDKIDDAFCNFPGVDAPLTEDDD